MLKVLIADDHAVIRQGLRRYLTSTGDITIVAEAATASDVLAHLGQHACDVLLMDLSLGHTSGFEIMSAVKALRPHLPIVIFTLHEKLAYVKAAWLRGATGYVVKTRPLSELVTAIRYAARGTKYVSPTLDDMTAVPLALAGKPLSRRQKQVLLLRGQGQHAAQIGAALGITAKTVSAHEEKILEKLQLHSRHELLPYAARQAMVEQGAVVRDGDSIKTVCRQLTARESGSQYRKISCAVADPPSDRLAATSEPDMPLLKNQSH
ncbi:MAG: response regulator transcription factor [Nitrospirota bacterium]|nr:response regulator transcription factor [Nitrospirota bacterium]